MMMLILALILDLLGLLIFILDFLGIGLVISFIPDLIGTLIIGTWGTFKGKSSFLKKFLKVVSSIISEVIPVWGDICPTWTIFVLTTKE